MTQHCPTAPCVPISSVPREHTAREQECISAPSPGELISSPNADPAESIPTMLDSFQSREVRAGRLVELPCIASGYPNPAIRWLKDGRPLPADGRWAKRITGLSIADLRVEDSGTYIC